MKPFSGSNWSQIFQKQEYRTWCGYAFETICLKHAYQVKKGLKCDQIQSSNYSWSNDKAQIDLVIDRDDGVITLSEIKFFNDEMSFTQADLDSLRNKENQFRLTTKTKKGIYTGMLTTWGVKPNEYTKAIVSSNLTMHCLFD